MRSIPVWYKGEIAARALVDNQDFEKASEHVWYLVVTGLYQKQYYAKAQVKEANGKWRSVWMHRYILGLPPRTPMVDHIDRSGLNNTRENLRLVTTSENNQNARPGLQANKTSRYRGVCWLKRQQRWLTTVCVNGKDVFKRTFVTEDEAAEAVANARAYYMPFSEEARTRKNHMCPLKLLPLNYLYLRPHCWPFCAQRVGVSSHGVDPRRMADGASWGPSRYA